MSTVIPIRSATTVPAPSDEALTPEGAELLEMLDTAAKAADAPDVAIPLLAAALKRIVLDDPRFWRLP